jgi:phosphoserine phosphatase RsbU/P
MTRQWAMQPAPDKDIATIGRISAIPTILEIIAETTGLRFAAVARVTETSWTACAVLDRLNFGLEVGGQLELTTTLCREVHASRQPIIIERASDDAQYCGHPTPKQYGFESYIAVPIIRRNGDIFGTICALDPLPRKLSDRKTLQTVMLFAELVAAQLEIEEQLEQSRSDLSTAVESGALREQFIAVLGHDLRNPISAVSAGAKMLLRQPLDERSAFIARQMESSAKRMGDLVSDILDFAHGRLGNGIPLEQRPVENLSEALRAIVSELQGAHPERVIHTHIEIEGLVYCDPNRIAQLFSNLLANALTHGDPNSPVSVLAQVMGDQVVLSVTNQGAPIPAETLPQLFQPYTRRTGNSSPAGLGLGLYIASEIARSHAGRISVSSSAQDGTTFTFSCPTGAVRNE